VGEHRPEREGAEPDADCGAGAEGFGRSRRGGQSDHAEHCRDGETSTKKPA
jgi:hypothetical protein